MLILFDSPYLRFETFTKENAKNTQQNCIIRRRHIFLFVYVRKKLEFLASFKSFPMLQKVSTILRSRTAACWQHLTTQLQSNWKVQRKSWEGYQKVTGKQPESTRKVSVEYQKNAWKVLGKQQESFGKEL